MKAHHELREFDFTLIVVRIVKAYVSNNSLPAYELPGLMSSVCSAIAGLSAKPKAEMRSREMPTPAQIRRSITPDGMISFEDGRCYKTMRRHLSTLGLTPETYRQKWGLASDYPVTSAAYSAQRSALAKSIGLGLRQTK